MTTREILSQLPKRIAERAIANAEYPDMETRCELSEMVYRAFLWVDTPEGHRFWRDVYGATLKVNKYPKLP
jgi:hypothetical protein